MDVATAMEDLAESLGGPLGAITTATQDDYASWAPLDLPDPFSGIEWAEVARMARGTSISFHMWSGSDQINAWVDGWLADRLRTVYGIALTRVPVTCKPPRHCWPRRHPHPSPRVTNIVADRRERHHERRDGNGRRAHRQPEVHAGEVEATEIFEFLTRACRTENTLLQF